VLDKLTFMDEAWNPCVDKECYDPHALNVNPLYLAKIGVECMVSRK